MTRKEKDQMELIYTKYTALLYNDICDLFDNNKKLASELEGRDNVRNFTCFVHALATTMPTRVYNKMASCNLNHLEFNQLANRLCFQFMELSTKKIDEKEDDVDLNIGMN